MQLHRLKAGPAQTRRRGCHCWELQDEPFAFADEFVLHAWIFSTGSSARI